MAVNDDVESIVSLQNQIESEEKELQRINPEFFARVQAVEAAKKNVDSMWDALKQKLATNQDFDVHEVKVGQYTCRFSLSKTVKIVPDDIEKVPEEFVSMQKVADEKRLKKFYELYGEVPEGCIDKSFVRLNKKISEAK